jgi:hypothetical protein
MLALGLDSYGNGAGGGMNQSHPTVKLGDPRYNGGQGSEHRFDMLALECNSYGDGAGGGMNQSHPTVKLGDPRYNGGQGSEHRFDMLALECNSYGDGGCQGEMSILPLTPIDSQKVCVL